MFPSGHPKLLPMSDRIRARDTGLRRISSLTKAVLAGGLALTGAFSVLAARAFSGRDAANASDATINGTSGNDGTDATTAPSPSDASPYYGDGGTSSRGFQPYSSGPQYSRGPSHVSSGGS